MQSFRAEGSGTSWVAVRSRPWHPDILYIVDILRILIWGWICEGRYNWALRRDLRLRRIWRLFADLPIKRMATKWKWEQKSCEKIIRNKCERWKLSVISEWVGHLGWRHTRWSTWCSLVFWSLPPQHFSLAGLSFLYILLLMLTVLLRLCVSGVADCFSS